MSLLAVAPLGPLQMHLFCLHAEKDAVLSTGWEELATPYDDSSHMTCISR